MRKSVLPDWKDRKPMEKCATILVVIAAFCVLLFALLDFLDVLTYSSTLTSVSLAIEFIGLSLLYWNYDKKIAYIELVASILMLIAAII